jgi:hypothetical protein
MSENPFSLLVPPMTPEQARDLARSYKALADPPDGSRRDRTPGPHRRPVKASGG